MDKKKTYVIIIAVLGLIGAAIFLYLGRDTSGSVFQPVNVSRSTTEAEKIFPPPDGTIYRMGLYLDVGNQLVLGQSVVETENNTDRALSELYFTVYPNAFQTREKSPMPSSAYRHGFNPGWLKLDTMEVNGQQVPCQQDELSLMALLPEDILPGQAVKIEMTWETRIPQAAYRLGTCDGVMMLSHIYPVLNVWKSGEWLLSQNISFGDPFCFQCADYLVKLNVPSEYQIISTGVVLGREADPGGRDTLLIQAERARDFVLVAAPTYQTLQQKEMDTILRCHVLPGYEEAGKEVLVRAARMFKYYSCTFGSYPYREFDIVQVPMEGFQGMEYSGVIFLCREAFGPAYGEARQDFLLAHEIAHQWWFGLVGNDQLREPWLDEGLANWSAWSYLRERDGKNAAARISPDYQTDLGRSLSEMSGREEYFNLAYRNGERFWRELEHELGNKKVIEVLRSYLAEYRYQLASAADLHAVIEKEAGQDMTPLFKKWFQSARMAGKKSTVGE